MTGSRSKIARNPASERNEPWKNLYLILLFNIPLATLLFVFDFWRVSVKRDSTGICSPSDSICLYTQEYGDLLPIVFSFSSKAQGLASHSYVQLIRELLLFNFIFWVIAGLVGVAAYAYSVSRFGAYRIRRIRDRGALPQLFAGGILFLVSIVQNSGPFTRSTDLLFHDWTGIFRFNACSILSSIILMCMVLFICEWSCTDAGVRAFGKSKGEDR